MKLYSFIFLTASLVSLLTCGAAHGQELAFNDPSYSAPVKWTEYRIASQKLSIPFPKLPVAAKTSDLCSQTEGWVYYAYAAGVVYEFEWHAKSRKRFPKRCSTKTKFSKAVFTRRLDEFKGQGYVESDDILAGIPAKVLRWRSTKDTVVKTRWLLWHDDRWLEIGVITRMDTPTDPSRFPGGLKLSSSSRLDIGKGASSTLGDADVDLKSDFEGKDREGMVVLAKPRPGYTDGARRQNTQGTVVLRVTFLRNGGIGAISVVKALPHGLTEQAIAAAKRISFLPGTVNGAPVSITRPVEYSFSIY